MSIQSTMCPRCKSVIKLDTGYDGEGGISYCCEHAFYWSREWTVQITEDNKRSFEDAQKAVNGEGNETI